MASLGRLAAALIVILTLHGDRARGLPQGRDVRARHRPARPLRATAGTLSIAYAKLPATGTRTGTLVLLSGGPGQAALPLTTAFAELVRPLRASYDIVTVDQRGTGGVGPDHLPWRPRGRRPLREDARPAAAFLTTPETANDLEDLRVALGADKLTLFGVSYGTSVAGEYVRRYPEHTAALVLDSPTPVDGLDGVDQLRTFGAPRVLREVCLPGPLPPTVPDPGAALAQAVRRLPLRGRAVSASAASGTVQ